MLSSTALLANIIGGVGSIKIPVFLQHREESYGKRFVLPVPALAAMLPECTQEKNVDEVERLFNDFVYGIALDVNGIFLRVFVHTYEFLKKRAAGALVSGPKGFWFRFV
jgi:hypothetical protein